MIDSEIWWRDAKRSLQGVFLLLPPLLLLTGCDLLQFVAPPPPPPPLPIRQTSERMLPDVDARLVPLPTPQQVVTAENLGRRNPFAPIMTPVIPLPPGVAAGSEPALAIIRVAKAGGDAGAQLAAAQAAVKIQPSAKAGPGALGALAVPRTSLGLQAPQNLQFTGVIQADGHTEAVVSYGGQSGSLRAGDRGGRSTELLPAGWAVIAIQLGGQGREDVPTLLLRKGSQRVKLKL